MEVLAEARCAQRLALAAVCDGERALGVGHGAETNQRAGGKASRFAFVEMTALARHHLRCNRF
eukprot:2287419-Rhodomonas_salina.1